MNTQTTLQNQLIMCDASDGPKVYRFRIVVYKLIKLDFQECIGILILFEVRHHVRNTLAFLVRKSLNRHFQSAMHN